MRKYAYIALIIAAMLSPVIIPSISAAPNTACGTVTAQSGVCQSGTCPLGQQCELAVSCSSGCISAGATSCYVCVNTIVVELCRIIYQIQFIIGILALLLFIMGGILWAGSHLLPSAGQHRSTMQGWAIGLVIAAVIMLILYVVSTPLIEFIGSTFNYPVDSCYAVLNPS